MSAHLHSVHFSTFRDAMTRARHTVPRIADATSMPEHVDGTTYVLSLDHCSGYAVRPDGELVLVFSTVSGRGAFLVTSAVDHDGAVYLDCFDGYLPTLYARHGFVEVDRVPNWTPGGPDVVYMARPGFESRHGK